MAWGLGLVLVLMNFMLKGLFLSHNALAHDEPFSVYHAQMDIGSIIYQLSQGNNPPLYELLLHFWLKLFGVSEFAVRFPSLLFSSVSVLLIYLIGFRYLNKEIGLLAGLIFIASNYHLAFAQEARVYAFLGMMSLLSMYCFMGLLQKYRVLGQEAAFDKPLDFQTLKSLGFLALLNAAIMYAHYFGFFILLVQGLFLVFDWELALKHWKKILAYGLMLTLFYAPNIWVLILRFMDSSGGTWVEAPNGLEDLYNMLWKFSNAPLVTVGVIVLFLACLLKLYWIRATRPKNIYCNLIVFWFVFIFMFMFLVSFKIPMFMDRYLMPAAIAYPLLLAIAVDFVVEARRFKFGLGLVFVAMFFLSFKPDFSNQKPVREVLFKIRALQTPRDLVLICPDWFELNFIYYYDLAVFKQYDNVDIKQNIYKYLNAKNIFPINSYKQLEASWFEAKDRVIYLDVSANFHYPKNAIKRYLDASYRLKEVYDFGKDFRILVYEII